MYRGRFAPSPTGQLHFGSLVAALASYLDAKHNQGIWLVRIEDVDKERSRDDYATHILKTLEQFHLYWDEDVIYQSQRDDYYFDVLNQLIKKDLIFKCSCTRRDLQNAPRGVDGLAIYPGTCRDKNIVSDEHVAYRIKVPDRVFSFTDGICGLFQQNLYQEVGDFVLKRSDGSFAYQLAVVADDINQNVTHIVRGQDLLNSTPRQIYLYECLSQKLPSYAHIPLALNEQSEKLSKQTLAKSVIGGDLQILKKALEFLNVRVNESIDSIDDLLEYAIKHWSIDNVPSKNRIFKGE